MRSQTRLHREFSWELESERISKTLSTPGVDGGQPCGDGVQMWTGTTETAGDKHKFLYPMQFSNTCIHERKASMDMNISMDIHVKTVDMEEKFHIHGRPATDTYGVVVECGVGAAGPQ